MKNLNKVLRRKTFRGKGYEYGYDNRVKNQLSFFRLWDGIQAMQKKWKKLGVHNERERLPWNTYLNQVFGSILFYPDLPEVFCIICMKHFV